MGCDHSLVERRPGPKGLDRVSLELRELIAKVFETSGMCDSQSGSSQVAIRGCMVREMVQNSHANQGMGMSQVVDFSSQRLQTLPMLGELPDLFLVQAPLIVDLHRFGRRQHRRK